MRDPFATRLILTLSATCLNMASLPYTPLMAFWTLVVPSHAFLRKASIVLIFRLDSLSPPRAPCLLCRHFWLSHQHTYFSIPGTQSRTSQRVHYTDLSQLIYKPSSFLSHTFAVWTDRTFVAPSSVLCKSLSVTGVFGNDAMLRQVAESVRINRVAKESLINTKKDGIM